MRSRNPVPRSNETMTRELRQLCDQVRQLAEKIRKGLIREVPDTPGKIVALYMFAKGYKSYQVALFLYREGFWQDAASVARTLLRASTSRRGGWTKTPRQAASCSFGEQSETESNS